MALKRLDKDISHVSKLPDIPTLENGYTPESLKERFDMAGEDIKEYINEILINELEGEMGASSIGIRADESLSGATVQEGLCDLAGKIREVVGGQIPDGTISPDKFVPSIASFIKEGSHKMRLFAEPGEHVFTPTRTGDYKITVQGAGGGGSVFGVYYHSYGGGSGAVTTGCIRLTAGHDYTVKIGKGGNGVKSDLSGNLLSNAECGEACGFYDGETELLFAEGGKIGTHYDGEATSRGGIICKTGECPRMKFKSNNSTPTFENGAGSEFASETSNKDMNAGYGAGGFGAEYTLTSYTYVRSGGQGGNGCVLIEWVE